MANFIRVDYKQSVATVTLNRPELHNAFNDEMIAELHQAFTEVGARSDVRAVVLAGEGKSFCAGADLNWMKRMIDYSFEENQADARALSQMLFAIRNCPKPVIARVHGMAFGGGVGLIAACDMAVSVEAAKFSLSEVKLGIIPAVISPFVAEKVGAHARRYALTAERFPAVEAHRIGLLSDVVADEAALDSWIQKITDAIRENGPEAVAACKVLFAELNALSRDEDKEAMTTAAIAKRRISVEGQEGMRAFLEKRSAAWIATAGASS